MADPGKQAAIEGDRPETATVPADHSLDRRAIAVAGLILAGVAATAGGALNYGLRGRESPIVVSPDTTLITEPLGSDGLPDHPRQALLLAGRGIRPDDNAAVPLLGCFWPLELDDRELSAVCLDLGVVKPDHPPTGFRGDDFLFGNHDVTAGIQSVIENRLATPPTADGSAALGPPPDIDAVLDATLVYGWRSAELPSLAAWVAANDGFLDNVVEASQRPHLYLPVPSLLEGRRGRLFVDLPPTFQAIQRASRGLLLRGMGRLGDGRFADAWSDILAIHRLARLVSESDLGSLVGHLTTTALSSSACLATLMLLESPEVPADVLATVRRDLDALGPLPEPRQMAVLERLGACDVIIHFAELPRTERADALAMLECEDPAVIRTFDSSLDWNQVLRVIVAEYTRLHTALGHATWSDRRQALDLLGHELTTAVAPPAGPVGQWIHAATMLASRRSRSQRIARVYAASFIPAFAAGDATTTRGLAVFELTRIAAALASWRADDAAHGYPERLDELVPRYLSSLPLDPFSDRPFQYERRDDGYLLYGAGQDGLDSAGTDFVQPIVRGEWTDNYSFVGQAQGTDNVIRVPLPPSPALEWFRGPPPVVP